MPQKFLVFQTSIISQFIFQKTLEQIPQRSFISAWEENGLSFADMRWPSATMKHQPTQQTTGSIRLPHRHTSFPKGWPRLPHCVSEDVRHPVGKDREMGSRESWLPQPLPSFVFGACCRSLACGRHHTTREGCVGAEGQSWFSRALQKLGLGLVSIWQLWIMPAFPVNVAMESQVSCCFLAGFLCDLFF